MNDFLARVMKQRAKEMKAACKPVEVPAIRASNKERREATKSLIARGYGWVLAKPQKLKGRKY